MKRFFRSLLRSFLWYLFLTLVCCAAVTIALIPSIGQRMAQASCDGTVESGSSLTMDGADVGQTTVYFCVSADGQRSSIPLTQIVIPAVVGYLGFMTLVIWPLLFVLFFVTYGKFGRTKTKHLREEGIPATATIVDVMRSAVAFNTTSDNDLGVNITMDVHVPDGETYQATTHATLHVTELMKLTPGRQVGVFIDRNNRRNIAIRDWGLGGVTG